MRLLFDGQARAWEPAAREMLPMYGQALDGVTVTVFKGEEGYLAKRDGDTATLLCAGKPELFRGLAVLLASGERLHMEQQTPFSTRGAMYDCSRNSVATVDTVKLILRRMAMMGLNVLMLYTEDTYEVPEYPSFGHYRGRYTAGEMKEIDDYADLVGIEVIPCIQALSHLERALRWQAMADIRDEGTTLYVGKPQTEAFIRAMLRAASSPVRSRRIHLGLDEAHGLGLGSKLEHEGYFEKPLLMKQHLDMLKGICNEMGLRPMMWGDMLFRSHIPGNGYYQDDISLPMSAKEMVPEGYDFIYWDYYHNDRGFYADFARARKDHPRGRGEKADSMGIPH